LERSDERFASRATAAILRIYAHRFDKHNHAARVRDALSAGFGNLLATGART
jgi:hypothetical protein